MNRPSLDFGDADRDAATQTFILEDKLSVAEQQSDTNKPRHTKYTVSADAKTKQAELELHFVKFQKVTDLTLFVADNVGAAETSVITQLDILSSEKMVNMAIISVFRIVKKETSRRNMLNLLQLKQHSINYCLKQMAKQFSLILQHHVSSTLFCYSLFLLSSLNNILGCGPCQKIAPDFQSLSG